MLLGLKIVDDEILPVYSDEVPVAPAKPKLSELMRRGIAETLPLTHEVASVKGETRYACAYGAIVTGLFGFEAVLNDSFSYDEFTSEYPEWMHTPPEDSPFYRDSVWCPSCQTTHEYSDMLGNRIIDLNDAGDMTREQIADALEASGL